MMSVKRFLSNLAGKNQSTASVAKLTIAFYAAQIRSLLRQSVVEGAKRRIASSDPSRKPGMAMTETGNVTDSGYTPAAFARLEGARLNTSTDRNCSQPDKLTNYQ
ncbi:unnamed protein product [Protopolystoma xenopodis]|uniref:Uncharacterized protein n=1 Tax=Protopolystoma xenopodis TaxID=117903 RepID=A0A448XNT3_9PLAT|nr:unnamed protein product [Protopolystoma xenopodis]